MITTPIETSYVTNFLQNFRRERGEYLQPLAFDLKDGPRLECCAKMLSAVEMDELVVE